MVLEKLDIHSQKKKKKDSQPKSHTKINLKWIADLNVKLVISEKKKPGENL